MVVSCGPRDRKEEEEEKKKKSIAMRVMQKRACRRQKRTAEHRVHPPLALAVVLREAFLC